MPVTPLVAAIRAGDAAAVAALLSKCAGADAHTHTHTRTGAQTPEGAPAGRPVDINEMCDVESTTGLAHETPLYRTFPLFEAVRMRNDDIIRMLLAHTHTDTHAHTGTHTHALDVNAKGGNIGTTALGYACSVGDVDTIRLLLDDPRVDATLGDAVVPHPAVYGCAHTHTRVLELFNERGLLTDDIEGILLDAAAAAGNEAALAFLKRAYVGNRALERLEPRARVEKIRQVCARFAPSTQAWVDVKDLGAIAAALDTPLAYEELREAAVALNPSGDGRIQVATLAAWWLGPDGVDTQAAAQTSEAEVMAPQGGGVSSKVMIE